MCSINKIKYDFKKSKKISYKKSVYMKRSTSSCALKETTQISRVVSLKSKNLNVKRIHRYNETCFKKTVNSIKNPLSQRLFDHRICFKFL